MLSAIMSTQCIRRVHLGHFSIFLSKFNRGQIIQSLVGAIEIVFNQPFGQIAIEAVNKKKYWLI